jgi:hypothetical protein
MESQNQIKIIKIHNVLLCCKDIDISDIYVGHTFYYYKRTSNHKTVCTINRRKVIIYIYVNLLDTMDVGLTGE